MGILQYHDGNPYVFNWSLKSGGQLSLTFNELNDEAGFDALAGTQYRDAQWQVGSTLSLITSPVPEPENYVLMLLGLGLVASMSHRKKTRVLSAVATRENPAGSLPA